jgi:hypothetical protein
VLPSSILFTADPLPLHETGDSASLKALTLKGRGALIICQVKQENVTFL